MNIRVFELERIQSLHENTVDYNLTESGFHPYKLNELLTADQLAEIENTVLGYGQTNGSFHLRRRIASYYPGCDENNILVTNGSSEANFVACHTILEKGDEVIMMVPNYMQIQGIAEEIGCDVKFFHLHEENRWSPDLNELEQIVSPNTKMIAICNPNNPTGYALTEDEMQEIVQIAKKVDSWIYADEIYRGAELNNIDTPSFIGYYDKVMVSGGLSKAYALPGLRLGWLAGPREVISNSWAYHDYTSITAGILSHKVGEFALLPEIRSKILNRNRNMLRENLAVCQEWLQKYNDVFHFVPPKAGGMAFIRYSFNINSTILAEMLRKEKSLFILAGDVFGMDKYFRIGIGAEKNYLTKGLELLSDFLFER
ncbi:MAG TPA: aminotransferase class I/II-fold pyridoxal phosphate-dependent enzyme [Bacteroidales bacterium]|nr:aminotransferase class I/II-fold pyridoxal phosphate-dependent enzyme [Bacteroidales bacterium]